MDVGLFSQEELSDMGLATSTELDFLGSLLLLYLAACIIVVLMVVISTAQTGTIATSH
ncbi:hypothetical protein [Alistipes putredinis]|jgi:hypothetical protein|uniref:hypothetical protein n=1 Tax=Alistipes putredinis TaxID=28117 RepID=UPI0018996336